MKPWRLNFKSAPFELSGRIFGTLATLPTTDPPHPQETLTTRVVTTWLSVITVYRESTGRVLYIFCCRVTCPPPPSYYSTSLPLFLSFFSMCGQVPCLCRLTREVGGGGWSQIIRQQQKRGALPV
jgi:hypothetical protein